MEMIKAYGVLNKTAAVQYKRPVPLHEGPCNRKYKDYVYGRC